MSRQKGVAIVPVVAVIALLGFTCIMLYQQYQSQQKSDAVPTPTPHQTAQNNEAALSLTPYINPTSTPTPAPLFPKTLMITTKGEVELDNSVTGNLVSAHETENYVHATFQFRNKSDAEQKVYYFMIDLEAFEAYDEASKRFVRSNAEPVDTVLTLSPGELKEIDTSFKKVPKPYIWYYRGISKRVTFGSYSPSL